MLNPNFNLFLATGSRQYLEMLLTCNQKNILISYAYPEPWGLKPLIKRNNVNLLCDSGAFTAWSLANKKKRQGDPNWQKYLVDIEKYYEFIMKNQDIITRVVNLDVIPGEQGQQPTQQQIIDAAEQGWKNYQWFKAKGINTIHVFHYGEPFEYLDRMLAECDYIGISPSNDLHDNAKQDWLDRVFRYILKSNNPTIKTHGFGVTSKRLVMRYPWFSCDSSSYSLTAAMGGILTPYGRVYISDQNQFDPDHILRKPIEVQRHIEKYLLENVGYNIKQMCENNEVFSKCPNCEHKLDYHIKAVSYKPRNFANIVFFQNMEKERLEKGPGMEFMAQNELF